MRGRNDRGQEGTLHPPGRRLVPPLPVSDEDSGPLTNPCGHQLHQQRATDVLQCRGRGSEKGRC